MFKNFTLATFTFSIFKLSIFGLSIFITSCGGGGYEGDSPLQKEVFKVHDEVMPLQNTIYDLRKDLLLAKSGGTFDKKTVLTAADKQEIDSVCFALTRASDGMDVWMRGFKDPIGQPMADADKYFKAELPKIQAVATAMKASVEKAKALTARFPVRAPEADKPTSTTTAKRDTSKKAKTPMIPTEGKPEKPTVGVSEEPFEGHGAMNPPAEDASKKTVVVEEKPKPAEPKPVNTSTTPKVAPSGSRITR